jgi:hypothetical protein
MTSTPSVLFFLLGFYSNSASAEQIPKCAYIESAVRLQVLEVNYCLELHSSNKSGSRQYVRYLRRTLRNTSPEPIETSFITDLTFSWVIGSDVMIESRTIKVPATDSEEAKDWQVPYTVVRLAPGESQEQRYRLSDFMIEKPKSKRRYSISLDPTIAFRFLNEPESKLAERMHWTKEDDEKGSRASVKFYDVHIR